VIFSKCTSGDSIGCKKWKITKLVNKSQLIFELCDVWCCFYEIYVFRWELELQSKREKAQQKSQEYVRSAHEKVYSR